MATTRTTTGPAAIPDRPAGSPEKPLATDDVPASRAGGILAAILLGALALRLAVWVLFQGVPLQIWDERDYNRLAVNLATRGEFAFEPGQPISLRPPLYPATLGAIYRLAGVENYQAARLYQVALGLVIVLLAYGLGRELGSRRVGLWAAGLCAGYPSLVIYTGFLLSELQFTALLLAGCLAVAIAYRRHSVVWLAFGGALLALTALTRSALWPFPIVMVPFLLACWRGRVLSRLGAVCVFTAAFALVLAPWAVRNTRLQQALTIVDCMGGRNLMMGNYEHTPLFRAWAAIEMEGDQAWHTVLRQKDPTARGVTQGQLDKKAMRYAAHYMAAHPLQTIQRDVVKFFNFWGLEREVIAGVTRGSYGDWSSSALLGLTVMLLGSYAAAMLLGLLGAIAVPPANPRVFAFIVLVIAVVCGAHTLTFGHSRYHLPVMPLVLVFAATAIAGARAVRQRRETWSFRLALAMGLVLIMAWTAEVFLVYRENLLELVHAVT